MDYTRLRAAALKEGEAEEAVTVDTRALIDKVLARYSGEWTTLRELIQNAADAQATTVKIKWETVPSTTTPLPHTTNRSELLKHVITNHTLRRLLVQNNGQPFSKTDWARLKRIAEGNPDETKIGAFGVGFYSVFADCEEPFVSSGSEAMAFYWKGNALFTRKLHLPEDQANGDTAFVLDYRNTTTAVPNLLSVAQFLATSLTFVALQNIEFWIDDWKILSLQKKSSPSAELSIPRDIDTRTKDGLMHLASVDRLSTQIDASAMSAIGWKPQSSNLSSKAADSYAFGSSNVPFLQNFFSKLAPSSSQASLRSKAAREERVVQEAIAEDLTAVSNSSIFLRVTSAVIRTSVAPAFANELERATKKPPPKATRLAILTSSYDDTLASESLSGSNVSSKGADVFASVLPSKKPGGRVFIGFPTTQTTGAGLHISAPSVIPTVEREAIDLNARWVKSWNIEMLRAAGILTRMAFSNDMAELDSKFRRSVVDSNTKSSVPPPSVVAKYVPEALHILKTYTFKDSTPSGHVGQIIEEAFWTAYKKPSIEVYSSRGVLPTTKVRTDSDELAKFVDGIPVIIKDMKDDPFIRKLVDFGLVKGVTMEDVRQELEAKALNKDQLVHFISWAAKAAFTGELDPPSRRSLLEVAVATISDDENQGAIVALSTIKNFIVPTKIPSTLPMPPTTLPFAFTANVPHTHLGALAWEPLEVVPWLRFILESSPTRPDEENMMKSSKFAVQVLTVLSKNWDSLGANERASVVSFLEQRTVVPTKMGMRKPGESFFASVKLFDDLPTIQGLSVKDKFLTAIGVRKTVDLETIFSRLLNQSPEAPAAGQKKWSHVELIKYLASVRDDIPGADMKKLRESRICPAEAGPPGMESTKPTTQLYKVSELFEPKDTLRALRVLILQWPGPPGSFRPSSPEARFLVALGLRPYPTVPELVDMMASPDFIHREQARAYFIANHTINGYISFNLGKTNKAILPLMGNEKQLVPPSACYTDEAAAVLGFNILKKELHDHAVKFGVARDPPILECVNRLIANPPRSRHDAVSLFGYFTTRLGDLHENYLARLRDALIVPVVRKERGPAGASKSEPGSSGAGGGLLHLRPVDCYLGSSLAYGDIFDFVDFGATANAFLFKCGSRSEPSKLEIARLACSEPARLVSILHSTERYLNLLRSLAEDLPTLKKDRELFRKMKTAPFLLASREIPSAKGSGSEADDEETPIRHFSLAAANQIVIPDDYISYRLFKNSLICAPEEDTLETFYQALGSQLLSSIVQEDVKIGPHSDKQGHAAKLRKHVLERSKIFLYEYSKYRRDAIKHDAKWLERHLTVEMVRSVALRRSLRGSGQSHLEKRSAAATETQHGHVLYVSMESAVDYYQVGQALCQLLLNRPGQQAYFFFEPFLKLDLLDLKARGYNVDRILRAKQAEARMAEEERKKALEAEQMAIQEREQEWARQGQAVEVGGRQEAHAPEPKMPGAFSDDPPEEAGPSTPQHPSKKGKGFFANISKRFGLDHKPEAQEQLENFLPGNETGNRHQDGGSGGGGGGGQSPDTQGKGKKPDDGRVTSPAAVQQNLLNAIKATRPHGSSTLFSKPRTNEVKEEATYCDSTTGHDLSHVAEAPNGMQIYMAREVSVDSSQFLADNIGAIASFETVLLEVSAIFGLAKTVVHIFYDEVGPTIAFNLNGSVFCNLRYFIQLHAQQLQTSQAGQARTDATVWWWVVVAHELAHNLESTHNAHHSYYT